MAIATHTPSMASGPVISDEPRREDVPFIRRRLMILLLGFILVVVGFIMKIYMLTVVHGPEYKDLSDNNFLIPAPLISPRGRIMDRNQTPLAINQTYFDVEMSPFHLKRDQIHATVERLSRLLGQPDIVRKESQVAGLRPKWKSVTLARRLELAQVLPVVEQGFTLPGVIVTTHFQRYYPEGTVTSLITGHLGGIDKTQQDNFLEGGYDPNERVGKLNAEMAFESLLHGDTGLQIVTRDAQGRPRGRPYIERAARPGKELLLTIDIGLQRLADELLEGSEGVIVAMDPRDGSVLAMTARPNYDPNRPEIQRRAGRSSYNKVTRGVFAPGSTFKLVTASAGLNAGYAPTSGYHCDGKYHGLGGGSFPCHWKPGHSYQDLYGALQRSCNIYFYTWAHKLGPKRMVDMAAEFGFGSRTEIDVVPPMAELPGILAHPGIDRIYLGSVLHMGIGQGNMIGVTPIQMARAYCAIANSGTLWRPHVIKEVREPEGHPVEVGDVGKPVEQGRLSLSPEAINEIREGLWRVVHERGGTGFNKGFKEEWRVAGKTGTAQTGIKGLPSNAWFACYAPADAPEICIVVLIEHGGHGGDVAAPVARQLLAHHFGKPEPRIVTPIMAAAEAASKPHDGGAD